MALSCSLTDHINGHESGQEATTVHLYLTLVQSCACRRSGCSTVIWCVVANIPATSLYITPDSSTPWIPHTLSSQQHAIDALVRWTNDRPPAFQQMLNESH